MSDINKIEISSKLESVVKNAIAEGYKSGNKAKKKNKNKMVAASIGLLLILLSFNSDFVSASVEKLKNNIENFINYNNINSTDFTIPQEFKAVIGKSIKDKGITVTLNECYIDTDMLYITTTLKGKSRMNYAQGIEPDIYMDNKLISEKGYTSTYIHNSDGTVNILSSYLLENINVDQKLNIKIDYKEIEVTNIFDNDKKVKGDWNYNFEFDGSAMSNELIVLDSNKLVANDGTSLVSRITISPYKVTIITKKNDAYFLKSFKILDENGNEYKYSNGQSSPDYMIMNYLFDTTKIKTLSITPSVKGATPIVVNLR